MINMVRIIIVCAVMFSLICGCNQSGDPKSQNEILIAVAANAQPAVEEIARAFEAQSNVKVTLSAGATGLLQRQATEGAPFDIFISADMTTPEALGAKGIIDAATVAPYADGVLVLWQPAGDGPRLSVLADLARPEFDGLRLAIANPEHAPYGRAAKQTLENLGLWQKLEPNIVYGENVGQVLQFAKTGNVGAALLPLSLIRAETAGVIAIDESLYDPIRQGLGIMTRTQHRAAAEAFIVYLRGPAGVAIMQRYGYKIPVAAEAAQP